MRIVYNQSESRDRSYGYIEFYQNDILLFNVIGNLFELLNWLLDSKTQIIENLFFFGNETNSLASRLDRAREIEFNLDMDENVVFDQWHGHIFEYYKYHGLTFGLRGFDNKDIIIGKNMKAGEFSCCEAGKDLFRFKFDLNEFYNEVEIKYQELQNEN